MTDELMSEEPLIVEDTLLLLFQPDSGTIAGENILFYVLGGAVLADLALAGRVEAEEHGSVTRVRAVGVGEAPDPLLEPALSSLSKKPQDVQTVLAGAGPLLREPVLDRVIARGDLRRTEGKFLRFFPTTKITLASDRRDGLIRNVRAALIDGEQPSARTAASIALLSASGTLPQFHAEIPWGSDVHTRAKALENGDWGAAAASSAVVRTMNAVIMNTVIAATVLPRL
ncbi:GPP34 family phosphoprotein [Microbacterium sp.]|uniref:GOLPH3/VPS74 family protein n=1 Tax=Microbacterium sp. TaxID=51671 RepID=UPI002811B2C0|nr:GPP34 family phosphoprotein [Microbacterium sp.]